MRAIFCMLLTLFALLASAVPVLGETRALLVACSDFISQPDLGSAISGNLHMIGSVLLGADPPLSGLSVEDGTIGTYEALDRAISDAFNEADEDDFSILYLCTHGMLSSSDDEQVYLLLGNGKTENPINAENLCRLLSRIQGEKLLILDACYSGAMIGRGEPESVRLPGARKAAEPFSSPFLADKSIHVLTSASGSESSWYYDSAGLQSGAVSYFASAIASGLGLYGSAEADANSDGHVSLSELSRYLSIAVPSSSSQLLSADAENVMIPTARGTMLTRPLSDFSYGSSLLSADDPTLHFSFTVRSESAVQYRLIEYENGAWNWTEAQTFLDEGDHGGLLLAGRHNRSLSLPTITSQDSGYLMLQVFSVADDELILCSERLIAVKPTAPPQALTLTVPPLFSHPGHSELPIQATLGVPSEITITIYDQEGHMILRPASGELTRPSVNSVLSVYWDGRDRSGVPVPDGCYTIVAETFSGSRRIKASADVVVRSGF